MTGSTSTSISSSFFDGGGEGTGATPVRRPSAAWSRAMRWAALASCAVMSARIVLVWCLGEGGGRWWLVVLFGGGGVMFLVSFYPLYIHTDTGTHSTPPTSKGRDSFSPSKKQ